MGTGIDRHLNDEETERYAMGSVSEEEMARLEEHLLICEPCQVQVTESDVYVAAMEAAGMRLRREPPKPRWEFLFFRLAPVAAAAALLVVLTVVGTRVIDRGAGAPAVAVTLEARRGSLAAKAPAGRPLVVHLDLAGLPEQKSCRVEAVDSTGNPVWKGEARVEGSEGAASMPGMNPGLYFVRVYEASGRLVREYGLEVSAQ